MTVARRLPVDGPRPGHNEMMVLANYATSAKRARLLVDSRVMEVPMVYHPTFAMLYSLKSFFFHGRKKESPFSDNVGV